MNRISSALIGVMALQCLLACKSKPKKDYSALLSRIELICRADTSLPPAYSDGDSIFRHYQGKAKTIFSLNRNGEKTVSTEYSLDDTDEVHITLKEHDVSGSIMCLDGAHELKYYQLLYSEESLDIIKGIK